MTNVKTVQSKYSVVIEGKKGLFEGLDVFSKSCSSAGFSYAYGQEKAFWIEETFNEQAHRGRKALAIFWRQ